MSSAPGLDTCPLYENDSDQDVYLFPLPVVDECFSTGAARSVCPTTFRPDVPIEPSEEIPTASGGRHESRSGTGDGQRSGSMAEW